MRFGLGVVEVVVVLLLVSRPARQSAEFRSPWGIRLDQTGQAPQESAGDVERAVLRLLRRPLFLVRGPLSLL
ncbi:hypothetical protein [Streptomyces sp. Amel2xC10]|uniref:hypothetical protein n=1 Tax=Streptomyces sp. Amel2xC10 TaxID=1305826 RepID=UPI00117D2B41|nr:hypothetical protein [Streptomyces sp. Amel2xC10]